jgi:putative ABC transport system permease protein
VAAAFLAEAIALSGLGGLAGLMLGSAMVRVLVRIFPALPAAAPLWAVGAALGVSLLTGAVFGLQPARRAARLDPILALARR